MANSFDRFASRQVARLQRRLDAFVRPFESAEAKIATIILAAVVGRKLWEVRERRRRTAEVQEVLRDVYAHVEEQSQDIIYQHFQAGQRIAEASSGERAELSRVQREALRILQENLEAKLADATRVVGRRVEDLFRREGLAVAAANIRQDVPQGVVSMQMRKALEKEGLTAFIDSAGRHWTLEHYAKVASYTVTQEALTTASRLVLLEQGFDLVEINTVKDPCPECVPYNGGIFSLTGRSEEYSLLDKNPPFHPQCRHFLYLAREGILERARLTPEEQRRALSVRTPHGFTTVQPMRIEGSP